MSPKATVTRAYGYLRVSTQEQGKSGLGLDAQRHTIEQFAQVHGLEILGFVEEVQTGKGQDALVRRPKLASLLRQCKREKVALIVARTSRLARNVAFGASILLPLKLRPPLRQGPDMDQGGGDGSGISRTD